MRPSNSPTHHALLGKRVRLVDNPNLSSWTKPDVGLEGTVTDTIDLSYQLPGGKRSAPQTYLVFQPDPAAKHRLAFFYVHPDDVEPAG